MWTTTTPVITINGIQAQILFSGLAPGFIGLYQVNLIVPAGQGHSFWEGFFHCQPLVDFVIARARAGAAE